MTALTLPKSKFCVHPSFYSFIAYGGSEGTTAGSVVSPRSTMVHHCFRSKQVRRAIKQNDDYAKQHHNRHCWLSAKETYPRKLNQISPSVDSFNYNYCCCRMFRYIMSKSRNVAKNMIKYTTLLKYQRRRHLFDNRLIQGNTNCNLSPSDLFSQQNKTNCVTAKLFHLPIP